MRTQLACAAGLALILGLILPVDASQVGARNTCLVTGKATGRTQPLPGVSIIVRDGDRIVAVTSTIVDGTYTIRLAPETTYGLTAELTAFVPVERELIMTAEPCDRAIDLEMSLVSRSETVAPAATPGAMAGRGVPPIADEPAGGRGVAAGRPGFETLQVETEATAAAGLEVNPPDRDEMRIAMQQLLPPGFSTDGPTEAVALNGDMARIDRGGLNDRSLAIGRGEFDPVTGQFAEGFDPSDPAVAGRGGRGGRQGGRGDFTLGGRGRGQQLFSATSNYTLGGSAFDAAPYQLRPDNPVQQQPYTRQNFGVTVGGPVIIPGVYDGTQKTTFNFSYTGNRSSNFREQYATVPSLEMRAGDFSSLAVPVIDPATGRPFAGNRIPTGSIDEAAQALLPFIPEPNLPGDSRNYYFSTNTNSLSDNATLRVTHAFVGRAGRGGGRGGGGGRPGGRGGRGATSVSLNAQMQYRRNENDTFNVVEALAGTSRNWTVSVPIGLNISKNRNTHAINVNLTQSKSRSTNQFAGVEDVAGNAGIQGVATDPFDWGVPTLNFATFTNIRDVTPTRRSDRRLSVSYTWTKPSGNHTFRMGGDFRKDWSENQTDANSRGEFLFTGLYTTGSSSIARGGIDFADFLLGLPQQASLQFGPGNLETSGRSLSAYFQDDWRARGNLTLSLGLRYELIWPFVETNGQMVTLDVNDDFTSAIAVQSGQTGPFSGPLPDALVGLDANNVAPRLGVAWRTRPGTILRGGYGVAYNSGSYSSISRQLVSQPPFATVNTSVGTLDDPLLLTDPFVTATPETTTNNYGIDPGYSLGVVQTWNGDVAQTIGQIWEVGAGYTGIKGTSLDMVRAPNRGPDGLRIDDVQPFTWQTSEAASQLHALAFRLNRRYANGLGAGVTYTLARSRDNASSLGGGRTIVAQNDQDLEAEWGLSSFDRRHQFTANANVDLPFGADRRWLNNGGFWAQVFGNWRAAANFTWQSGTPYTPTVSGSASEAAAGTSGSLRADYTGDPIALPDPTIDLYFNTAAFLVPDAGTFGSSARNVIIGPGSKQLNATFSRDLYLGGFRTLTVQVRANNLLNMVNYGGLNTNVNSPSFGQITSVRAMRSAQLNFRFRF